MGGLIVDSLGAGGDSTFGTGKWTVADLEFDYILAGDLEPFRHREDIEGGFGCETKGEAAKSSFRRLGCRSHDEYIRGMAERASQLVHCRLEACRPTHGRTRVAYCFAAIV